MAKGGGEQRKAGKSGSLNEWLFRNRNARVAEIPTSLQHDHHAKPLPASTLTLR
jgi:hypothetical protein